MRIPQTLALFGALAAVFHIAQPSVAAPGDVKRTLNAPCAWPAGLASDGASLYVLDWREAQIHQVNPTDGHVVRTLAAPTLKPHGLTWGDGKLFVSDSHSGWVYVMDPERGIVTNSFEAPGSRATGLAYADDALFLLEGKSRQIYKVLPEDGTILGYFETPTRSCACLAYDGRYLWVSDRVANELYMVEPGDGQVLGIITAPGPYPAGLTWHDGQLWNVDFQTRKLYELVTRDEQKYRLTDAREARAEYVWALYNYGPGEVRNLNVNIAIPDNLPSQELLSDLEFSLPPTRTAADRWGQRCALFEIPAVPAGTRQVVSFHVNARISAIRYLIFPEDTGTLDDIPADIRQAYTVDGSRYRIDTPHIRDTVRKIVGDERNPYWIARKVFNHLISTLEYEMVGGWDVPEVVLKRGTGSCSEYTFAFIALCRAAGLPARYQGSVVVRGDEASIDESFHRWAEIYLPNYGWVPVDANKGDARTPADQARGFGELANRFLITTRSGGDSEYLAWGYNSSATYQATGYCHIEQDNLGFWEPLTTTTPANATPNAAPAATKPEPK